MADLTGRNADETKPDIATWGTGNVLETGEGTVKVDLDNKASLSAINNDEDFAESGIATLQFQGATSGVGTEFSAYWTRVMDHVTIHVSQVEDLSSFSGEIELTGLPFVPDNLVLSNPIRHGSNVSYPSGTTTLAYRINSGSTTMEIGGFGSGNQEILTGADISGTSFWSAIVQYRRQAS